MTEAADLILTNAAVHTLADPDGTHEAVAIRDGRIVRVDTAYEVAFLEGVETTVYDLDGRVVLPGFIDAHTHLEILGRRLVHADLSAAADRDEAVALLRAAAGEDGWILGYGYDESTWPERRYLDRADLDRVSTERPVIAFREDLHTASVNGVVLERLAEELPESGLQRADGEPTGVVTEATAEALRQRTAPDRAELRSILAAARDYAHARGVTGVHDMVRHSEAPAVYRALERDGDLDLRVRLYYWTDHLDAVAEVGLVSNHGGRLVRVGGIKSYTDGSIGARTAKLSEPYADAEGTGEWITPPEELAAYVERADDRGLQVAIHAIGDEAVAAALDALEGTTGERHRIEHAELAPTDLAGFDAVASMQPNFLRWARPDGLYESRLGTERTRASNRFAAMCEAGVPLAFGSDCMPLDPLFGVQQAVTAPTDDQRLSVTEALRAYTRGAAYAGFDEDRLGTIAAGTCADLVVLAESPWTVPPETIGGIDVAMTVVDGRVVYRDDAVTVDQVGQGHQPDPTR